MPAGQKPILDFAQFYKDIKDNVNNGGCSKSSMEKALNGFKEFHRIGRECANVRRIVHLNRCFSTITQELRDVLTGIDEVLDAAKCHGTIFDPIRTQVREAYGWANYYEQIEAAKDFAKANIA